MYSIDPVEGCIVAQCRGRVYRRRVWIFPWLLQFLRETSISIWTPVFISFVSYYLPQWIGFRVWNIDSSALCTKHTRHIFISCNAACHNFDSTISCRVLPRTSRVICECYIHAYTVFPSCSIFSETIVLFESIEVNFQPVSKHVYHRPLIEFTTTRHTVRSIKGTSVNRLRRRRYRIRDRSRVWQNHPDRQRLDVTSRWGPELNRGSLSVTLPRLLCSLIHKCRVLDC